MYVPQSYCINNQYTTSYFKLNYEIKVFHFEANYVLV